MVVEMTVIEQSSAYYTIVVRASLFRKHSCVMMQLCMQNIEPSEWEWVLAMLL